MVHTFQNCPPQPGGFFILNLNECEIEELHEIIPSVLCPLTSDRFNGALLYRGGAWYSISTNVHHPDKSGQALRH